MRRRSCSKLGGTKLAFDFLPTLAEVNAIRRAKPNDFNASRSCERCGKPIPSGGRRERNRFCGRQCAAAYSGDVRRKVRPACRVCGKAVPDRHRQTCSAACYREAHRRRWAKPSRSCERCGLALPNGAKRFCSHQCHGAIRKRPRANCEVCGKVVNFSASRFCSRKCSASRTITKRPADKPCSVCGVVFTPERCGDRGWTKFCSRKDRKSVV